MQLYVIPFTDGREQQQIAAVKADSPEEALDTLIAYQTRDVSGIPNYDGSYYNGFACMPDLDDVRLIDPDDVQIL